MKAQDTISIAIIDHVGMKAGMDYYSSSLAKGLSDNHASCTVYSNFSQPDETNIVYRNYFEGHSQANAISRFMRLFAAMIKSSSEAGANKSDLVIIHLFSANLLTLLFCLIPKLFRLKLAIIAHDIDSFANNDNATVQKIIYSRMADYIIVHNQYSRDCLLRHISTDDACKVHVIKHGGYMDFIGNAIDRNEARRQLGLEADKKYLLFFGQIKKVKGLDILLEAMPEIRPDIHLIIAGKPWKDDFSHYEQLIHQHGLQERVKTIIRFIPDKERKLFFFAADVNILPYRVIYQSGVLLMAMSHGLPVIASNLPANSEIIRNGENGLLFTSENSASLAQCINTFFSDHQLPDKLGAAALETIATEYNWQGIAADYLKMLKQ